MTSPTFLFVHGAWHGSWCWQRVGSRLVERQLNFDALDLPSSSGVDPSVDMNVDASALVDFSRGRGPVVLIAHSYGGAVVAEAAPQIESLAGIVYLAALVPRLGQSASDVTREYGMRSALDAAIHHNDEGYLHLDPLRASRALYGDCDEETRKWAIEKVAPQSLASFRTPRSAANTAVPSVYVICSRDEAIVPEVQERMAERCSDTIVIDSDHSPFLSHPDEVIAVLKWMSFSL